MIDFLTTIIIIALNVKYLKDSDRHQVDKHHHQVHPHTSSLSIVVFAVTGLIYLGITSLIGAKFFMVFSPIFMA
jgi:hypothetical protein